MPPRIPCLRARQLSSSSCIRSIHTSSSCRKSLPSNIFSSSTSQSSKPFSQPSRQTPSSSSSSSSATPSKFNLLNHHLKKNAPRGSGTAFRFSSIKPSPISNWGINVAQNRGSDIRIHNPVSIDPKSEVDEEELKKLIEENNQNYTPVKETFDPNLFRLEKSYSFPLTEGQLYTHHDLTFDAWKNRHKVREAVNENPVDPFEKLNIDPIWEFKNYSLLSNFVSSMGRMLPSNKTGCSTRNQRRLAKAIRRSRALGFLPIWARHPSMFEGKQERHSFAAEFLRGRM